MNNVVIFFLSLSLLGDPEELMFQYFKKFGDKPCCFTDLKVFVDLLPATQCTKVSIGQISVGWLYLLQLG